MLKQSSTFLTIAGLIVFIILSTLLIQYGSLPSLPAYLDRADLTVEEQFAQYTSLNRIQTLNTKAICISGDRGEALLDGNISPLIRSSVMDGNTDIFLFVETSLDVTMNAKRNGTFEISRLLEL